MSADPISHRLIATVNEDGNSSLYTISPVAPAGDQIAHDTYSVQPLTHGGGTDAISVYRGAILINCRTVDDTAWAIDAGGTLFVTDAVDNEIFTVRGAFVPGTACVAVTPGDGTAARNHTNYLGRLDLRTGHIATVVTSIQATGLVSSPDGPRGYHVA